MSKNKPEKNQAHANANEAQPGTTVLNRRKQKAVAKAAMIKALENAEEVIQEYMHFCRLQLLEPENMALNEKELKATIEVLSMFREGLQKQLKY